jgi:hypothetical protein
MLATSHRNERCHVVCLGGRREQTVSCIRIDECPPNKVVIELRVKVDDQRLFLHGDIINCSFVMFLQAWGWDFSSNGRKRGGRWPTSSPPPWYMTPSWGWPSCWIALVTPKMSSVTQRRYQVRHTQGFGYGGFRLLGVRDGVCCRQMVEKCYVCTSTRTHARFIGLGHLRVTRYFLFDCISLVKFEGCEFQLSECRSKSV